MPRSTMCLVITFLTLSLASFPQESNPTASTPAPAPRHHQAQRDRAEQRLNRLSKRLNLTADQKEKIRPILQDEEKQMKTMDEDTSLTPQQKHKKTREIRMSSRSQMDGILTDEQKQLMRSQGPHGNGQHQGHKNIPEQGTSAPDQNTPR